MNEIIEKEKIVIENMIYEVRGVQVMLDSDIAKLYHVETKRVNEAVKNNPDKFPERFSFIITDFEKNKGLYYECAAMSQKVLKCMEKMRTDNGTEWCFIVAERIKGTFAK